MRVLRLFAVWYLTEAPWAIVRGYARYALALLKIIPFLFLLLTLFSPWKNILDRAPVPGLNIQRMLDVATMSLLARGVGCVVRIFTIFLGLLLHVFLLVGSVAYLAVWLLFPLLLVAFPFLLLS